MLVSFPAFCLRSVFQRFLPSVSDVTSLVCRNFGFDRILRAIHDSRKCYA